MTTARLATALCADSARECVRAIFPPMVLGDDEQLVNAWHEVQGLRRQWAGLIEIWPHKKEQFDRDLDAKIMEIAADLYEVMSPTSLAIGGDEP
jgi:hypothetical protein